MLSLGILGWGGGPTLGCLGSGGALGPASLGAGRPHLAQLHKQVGDPGLDALPEGVVLGPAGAGGEARPGPAPSRPAAVPHSQAAALVCDEVREVGQGKAVPEVEQGHGSGRAGPAAARSARPAPEPGPEAHQPPPRPARPSGSRRSTALRSDAIARGRLARACAVRLPRLGSRALAPGARPELPASRGRGGLEPGSDPALSVLRLRAQL